MAEWVWVVEWKVRGNVRATLINIFFIKTNLLLFRHPLCKWALKGRSGWVDKIKNSSFSFFVRLKRSHQQRLKMIFFLVSLLLINFILISLFIILIMCEKEERVENDGKFFFGAISICRKFPLCCFTFISHSLSSLTCLFTYFYFS